jgi:hypothetical protein
MATTATKKRPSKATKKTPPLRTLDDPRVLAEVMTKFRAELPELLTTHPGQWVAYTVDGERVIRATQYDTYHELLTNRHRGHDQFIISRIEPETLADVDGFDAECA